MEYNYKKDLEYVKNFYEKMEDLEKLLGVSRITIYRWINGTSVPSKQNLENLYNCLYKNNFRLNKIKEEIYKSLENASTKVLYHGSRDKIIGDVTIEKSNDKKDFGKGFYLGETLLQSASFVSMYPNSSVYVFEFCKGKNIKIKEYDVCKEWMILISYFRGKIDEFSNSKYLKEILAELKDVDVVIAPIADNTMYDILDSFSSGDITDLQCLNALSANWLGKQYVFLNDKVIKKSLKEIDRLYICEDEKQDYKTKRKENIDIGKAKVKLAKREFAGKGVYIEELLK